MTIRVAFVGAGYMASEHAKAMRDDPIFEFCGVFSKTQKSSEAFAKKYDVKQVIGNINDLYFKLQADLVVIAVPELQLFSICKETFKYPWVHLIEKPVGYNYAEAEQIAKLAHDSKSVVFVALNRRFYSSTIAVKEAIELEQGPKNFIVVDQESPSKALSAGQPEIVVENWMYANSIHMIDLLRYLASGEVISINNHKQNISKNIWNITSNIQFSSGDVATYVGLWNSPGPWSINCFTGRSRWELRPIEQARFQLANEFNTVEVPKDNWDLDFKPGLRGIASEISKYFNFGDTQLPTIFDALDSMRLVHDIYEGK